MPGMQREDRVGNGLSPRRALQESCRLLEKAGAVLGTTADVGQGRRVVRLQITRFMSFNGRHGALLVAALVGIAIGLFLPTLTQVMEKHRSPHNQMVSNSQPELRDPRLVIRKKARVLELYDGAKLIKTYSVVFGF